DLRVGFMRYALPKVAKLITANAADGSDERVVETSENQPQVWNPVWSPDGTLFTCGTRQKRADGNYFWLVNIPADGGDLTPVTAPSKQRIWSHTWLADQSGFLAVRDDPVTNLQQLVFAAYPSG